MRKALTDWQLQIHDAGLLPESEMLRRVAANKTTIYQLVRDPKLYNLPAYLAAADVALTKDSANLAKLTSYLSDADSGLRYWGVCGLVMQEKLDLPAIQALKVCLKDESHDVRAMAAWALIKAGHTDEGQACLNQLVREESYAIVRVLNVIDWMGGDRTPYLPTIKALSQSKLGGTDYVKRMCDYLIHPGQQPSVSGGDGGENANGKAKANGRKAKKLQLVPKDETIP
jgi:hypothetical protein